MAFPLSAAIGAGGAVLGGIFGAFQTAKANRLEKNNNLPIAQTNANILSNVALAENMANVGLGQQQYNNTLEQQNQNLASVIRSSGRSGRNTNVANILRQANASTQNLNVADAQARMRNQGVLMQQRGVLANEEQRVWNWNKAQPYLRMSQRIASLRSAGNQNIAGAVGTLTGIGMNVAANGGFGGSTGTAAPTTPDFYQTMSQYGQPNNGYNGAIS